MAVASKRTLVRTDSDASQSWLRRAGSSESINFYTHRLSLLSRLLARDTREMLEPFELSQMEWRILIQLEQLSPSKISEISARSFLQKPQISVALPLLIERGCVAREEDPDDARAPYFAITETGLLLYRSVLRGARKRQRRFELLLGDDERAHFSSAVDTLIATLLADEPREEAGVRRRRP